MSRNLTIRPKLRCSTAVKYLSAIDTKIFPVLVGLALGSMENRTEFSCNALEGDLYTILWSNMGCQWVDRPIQQNNSRIIVHNHL